MVLRTGITFCSRLPRDGMFLSLRAGGTYAVRRDPTQHGSGGAK